MQVGNLKVGIYLRSRQFHQSTGNLKSELLCHPPSIFQLITLPRQKKTHHTTVSLQCRHPLPRLDSRPLQSPTLRLSESDQHGNGNGTGVLARIHQCLVLFNSATAISRRLGPHLPVACCFWSLLAASAVFYFFFLFIFLLHAVILNFNRVGLASVAVARSSVASIRVFAEQQHPAMPVVR
jgi:hypothetical protein